MNLIVKKIISAITLAALLITSLPIDAFAYQNSSNLGPWLALSGGSAQRLIYFVLHVPRIKYAESDMAKELLARNCADALLMQDGSFLVDKSVISHNESIIRLFEVRDIDQILKEAEASPAVARALYRLTRVVLHENIEKLMRITAATDHDRYADIMALVFSQKKIMDAYNEYLSGPSRKRPPTRDLLLNDIVAHAFELILLKKAGIIDERDLSAAESAFAREAELVFAANKHNYFDAPFWNESELNKAVTRSLHIGYAGPPAAHSKGNSETPPESRREDPKTLKEKIAVLTANLKFAAPKTFEEKFVLYYVLRLALISDADQNKADDFKLHYRQMLILLEAISADLKAVKDGKIAKLAEEIASSGKVPDFILGQPYDMPSPAETVIAIRKELTGLTMLEFDKKTRGVIDDAIDDVVDELYDDAAKREAMKKRLSADVRTYHFANLIPIDSLEDDFSIHRESYRDKLIALPMALKAYACKIVGEDLILTHAYSGNSTTRSGLVHEMFHYLADCGEIKMPMEAESITFTAQFLDAITNAPGGDKEKVLIEIENSTKLPLFRELLNRGMELGLKGEVGFKVLLGLTGDRAEYFSLKGLLLEAQMVFGDNNLDPALLDNPYAAQMAIAAILTGQLLGLHEKEGIKPLRLLKDFFNDLARRCGPPSPEFMAWISADGGLLSELKRYASYLFAKRMDLAKKAEGSWSYEDKGELRGVIYYIETDLYPRPADGIDENDIEGKKKAVRERALAQLILAVSRELYGRHDLAERAIPEWKTCPEKRVLWDDALTANTIYSALGRNQARNKGRDGKERYGGAGLWITKLFRDRYQIGNPVIERALLTSLPLHLQYLDSMLYRWVFYDKTKKSLIDPRLVSEKVKEALVLTQGDAESPGWEALIFHPGQFKDDVIAAIIRDKMLPVYERLYDDSVKDAERKAAYEQMLNEDTAENMRKAIDQFTESELAAIDKYLGGLSDAERKEIKERAKKEMEEALREYMEKSQSQSMPFMDDTPKDSAPGKSAQKGEGVAGQGKPGARAEPGGSEGMSESIGSLKDRLDALEKNINELSAHLEDVESKAADTGNLSSGIQNASAGDRKDSAGRIDGLAGEMQEDVNASLQAGREIEAAANKIRGGAAGAADNLPQSKTSDDTRKDSESLAGAGAGLKERLERLQEAANRLKAIAERLKATVSGGEVDESHVRSQSDTMSETIGGMKALIKDIKDKGNDIGGSLSKLEGDLKQLEASARDIDKRKGAAGKGTKGVSRPEDAPQDGSKAVPSAASASGSSDIAPTDDTLEGLVDIARKCGSDLSEGNLSAGKPEDGRNIFDDRFFKGLAQEEAEKDRLREPLTEKEQRLYDECLQATKTVIDRMTVDLRARLNIPNVGIELETGLWAGPKLKDLVRGVMGLPPFAKRHEKEPRRVKITLMVDRSGSMDGDSIKYAKLTVFVLLNVIFNLNEELERLGFDPIEFEVGLFTTEEHMEKELQISHQTVADKPLICRERLIYNIIGKIETGGGTDDVSALGRYVTRIIESPDRGTDSSYRIFISIGDANLGTDANISDIGSIIRNAKERGVHIFGVSVGNDAAREHMKQVYGADNSILPKSLPGLPGDVMNKISECIPMPRRTAGISPYFALSLLWAFPPFFLSTDFNNAARMPRALSRIEGYRHFYIEKAGDKEYLVFKRDGVPERRWVRGGGGAYVPQIKVPDIDANEELILSILNDQNDFGQDRLIELIGETGLGKGEILRVAAHLLNEEYHFIAGNEDMEVEDLSETRSLGNASAGVSGYEPSVIAQVQHNGGWVVLDERNKIPAKVLNQLKSHLSGRNHIWNERDDKGNTVKRTVPNHPRARIFSTMNPHRVGIQSVSGVLDQAMQRRVKRVEFTWLPPKEEILMQSSYARDFAEICGKDYSGALKSDIEDMIEKLMRIAVKERLIFAGYNAAQIGKIIADWRLLKDRNFKPVNKRGQYLKRPPSPRVIKSIIRHMLMYPEDLKNRPWAVVSSYFNYGAENDKLNTFSNVVNDFTAEGIVDDTAAPLLKLDESSFTIADGHLMVRPVSAPGEKSAWDDLRVPLSSDASIRQGVLPERVKSWLKTDQNALMFYRTLQSIELGRDIIFVGEQETGKSKLAETVAELLSGPELEIQPITFSTSKEDITFVPHIGEDGAKAFQSGYKMQRLPRAMDDGKGRGKILIMEETTQGRPGIIGLLNEVAERGELPYPFSKRVIRKQEGFTIIHTINPPTKDYDVNAFSDEFLERHTIMVFKPLAPEQAYGYISDASKDNGLQVHPRLIGEVERDGQGNAVMINGHPKYRGILGIEQYIRDLRAKKPDLFPRAPGVGTNMNFAGTVRNNYEFYRSYYGLNGQQALMKIFTGLFTLDGPEEKVREWHAQIKAAFICAGLWTDAAGKDAVDEYLLGESVLVEGLPVLRKPHTGRDDLDRMLIYVQENTGGANFRSIQDGILKRCAELYDDAAWAGIEFSEKIERVYILKEVYQVVRAILRERPAGMYGAEDRKKFELISENIVSNLLIKKDWPNEMLTSDYAKDEFVKKCEGIVSCGDTEIDDLIGKMALFFDKEDYADEICQKLQKSLKARMGAVVSRTVSGHYLKNSTILNNARSALAVIVGEGKRPKKDIQSLIEEITAYLQRIAADRAAGKGALGEDIAARIAEVNYRIAKTQDRIAQTEGIIDSTISSNAAGSFTLDPSKIPVKPQIVFDKHTDFVWSANETTLEVDGKKIFVSASKDNTVRFFTLDPATHTASEVGVFDKHIDCVRSANETTLEVDDKKVFVSASDDNTVRFFTLDPATHTASEVGVFDAHTDHVLSVNETTLKADGKKVFVSASSDSTVRFFTLDPATHTASEVGVFDKHTDCVRSVNETTLKADGKKVFVSASDDKTVRFFTLDPATHTASEVGVFDKHTDWVRSANETTLEADGKKVFVSASDDNTVRFFTLDLATHTASEIGVFDRHTTIVLSSNETMLEVGGKKVFVSISYDNTVRFFTFDPATHDTNEVGALRPRDDIKDHRDRCLSASYIPGQKLLIASTGTDINSSIPDKDRKPLNAVLFWDLSEAVTRQAPDTGGARLAELESLRAQAASLEQERATLERLALVYERITAVNEESAGLIKTAGDSSSRAPGIQTLSLGNIDLQKTSLATTVIGEVNNVDTLLSGPRGVSFSSDGKRMAVANGGNNTVSIIDMVNKKLLFTIGKDGDIDVPLLRPEGVSFSNDDKRIAIASLNDTVFIIDMETNKLLFTIGEGKDIDTPLSDPAGVSFSSDDKIMAIANWSKETVSIIDMVNKKLLFTIGAGKDIDTLLSGPQGVSFSKDDKRMAVINENSHTVSIIDMAARKLLLTVGESRDIDIPLSHPQGVSFSSDGERIAVVNWGNGTVPIINIETKKLLLTIGEGQDINIPLSGPRGVSFLSDDKMIAVSNRDNNAVSIIDMVDKKLLFTIGKGKDNVALSGPAGVSFSGDGKIIAIVNGSSNTVSIIDMVNRKLLFTIGAGMDMDTLLSDPEGVSFSSDDKKIAIANLNDTVSIIDMETKKLLLTIGAGKDIDIPLSGPAGVLFSNVDKEIVVSNWGNNTISIIDIETKKLLLTIGQGKDIDTLLSGPQGVSFSNDGKIIAVANENNHTVSIIDMANKRLLLTIGESKDIDTLLSGPQGVSFSSDGKIITVANWSNNTVSIIDMERKKLLYTIGEGMDIDTLLSGPRGVSFSSDDKRIAISNRSNNTVSIIDFIAKGAVAQKTAAKLPDEFAVKTSAELESLRAHAASLEQERATLERLALVYERITAVNEESAGLIKTAGDSSSRAPGIQTLSLGNIDLQKTSLDRMIIGEGKDVDIPLFAPEGVSSSSDGKMIAVANWDNNTVSIIDIVNKKLLLTIGKGKNKDINTPLLSPADVSFSSDDKRIAVANAENNTVSIIDIVNKKFLLKIGASKNINIPLSEPRGVSFSSDDKRMAVSNGKNNTVFIIDMAAQKLLLTIGAGADIDTPLSHPTGVSFSSDDKRIAVANCDSNTVSIIDMVNNKLLLTIGAGADIDTPLSSPHDVSFSSDDKRIAIANGIDDTVSIIDIEKGELLLTIGAGMNIDTPLSCPTGVSFSSDDKRIAVSNESNNTVSIIDFIAKDAVTQKSVDLPDASAVKISATLESLRAQAVSLEQEGAALEQHVKTAIMPFAPMSNVHGRINAGLNQASQLAVDSMAGADPVLRDDTAMSVELFCSRMPSVLNEGRRYEIRYNDRILDDSYKGLMEEYVAMLNARFPSSEFKLVKSSFEGSRLFETKCYQKGGTDLIGEDAVNVLPEEGRLEEYYIRVVPMINITIAVSSIPNAAANERDGVIKYVASQYRSLTAHDLPLTGEAAGDIDLIRNLSIILPKAGKVDPGIRALKNDMMRALLRNA